jgi:hypothetical protein
MRSYTRHFGGQWLYCQESLDRWGAAVATMAQFGKEAPLPEKTRRKRDSQLLASTPIQGSLETGGGRGFPSRIGVLFSESRNTHELMRHNSFAATH